jgi:hypothetical protein
MTVVEPLLEHQEVGFEGLTPRTRIEINSSAARAVRGQRLEPPLCSRAFDRCNVNSIPYRGYLPTDRNGHFER